MTAMDRKATIDLNDSMIMMIIMGVIFIILFIIFKDRVFSMFQ